MDVAAFKTDQPITRYNLALKLGQEHKLNKAALNAFKHMAIRAGKSHTYFESQGTLADAIGFEVREVRRALTTLKKKGLIRAIGRKRTVIIFELVAVKAPHDIGQSDLETRTVCPNTPDSVSYIRESMGTEEGEGSPTREPLPPLTKDVESVEPRECEPLVGSLSRSRSQPEDIPDEDAGLVAQVVERLRAGQRLDLADVSRMGQATVGPWLILDEARRQLKATMELTKGSDHDHDQGGETQAVEERATANVAG